MTRRTSAKRYPLFTATSGEDGWTAGETCPLLLAAVSRKPPDETIVWQYAPANCRTVASRGKAGAVGGGKSIQSVFDKTGWEGRSQQFRNSRWGRRSSVPSFASSQTKIVRWNFPMECIAWGR